jgi:hypothetical protein
VRERQWLEPTALTTNVSSDFPPKSSLINP